MIRDLLLRKKIFEAEADIDKFLADNEIDLKANTLIQTLIFDKKTFEESEAREWARDHGFHTEKVDETEDSFRIRQVNPSQFDQNSFRTIEIRRGIKAVVGKLDEIVEVHFNDKGEELFQCSRLSTTDLSEGLPNIIEIARVAEGEHPLYGKLKITKEHLKSMVTNFRSKVTGVDLAINEDHKKNEAFGWFKDIFLSFDEEVLYGQIIWNRKGIQALSEKMYRYFSPEFRFSYVHPHSGKEFGTTLVGGALTNYPFLKMDAITELNNKTQGVKKVETNTTINLADHNAKVIELSNKIQEVQGKLNVSESRCVELNNKVGELTKEIDKIKKESAHKKLFDEGKINAAQLVALNEGKTMLEVLALSEKMNLEAKGLTGGKNEEIQLSEAEEKMCKQLGLTKEEYIAANKTA